MFEKSGNPALNYGGFDSAITDARSGLMSYTGVAVALCVLFGTFGLSFAYSWNQSTIGLAESWSAAQTAAQTSGEVVDHVPIPPNVYPLAIGGSLVGFVLALIIIFNPATAPYLSFLYSGCQGLALGAISAGAEAQYPGITPQAVGITFATFGGMLALYVTGILRATPGLFRFVMASMFGILGLYFFDIIFSLFGNAPLEIVHGNSTGSILVSLFIVGIAALNFTLDFGTIEEQVESKSNPQYMNWYGAFSLMVTFVWLYLEILRLLMKARSKND